MSGLADFKSTVRIVEKQTLDNPKRQQ